MNTACDHEGYESFNLLSTSFSGKVERHGATIHWCSRCGAIRTRNIDQSWSHWRLPAESKP